ncbi:MAG: T9SS type A sorting domain-containing protein, partial [Candidatus Delongbacteria bacterium]|nr:T9SS type A sorting domain-containing protein [Candidatus Delongbacteria bacterium]
DYGQLVVIGTSYFFHYSNIRGHAFLNSVIKELVDNRILTGIESEQSVISNYDLQAYPNPFNPSTIIKFNLINDSFVGLTVYNVQGQEVKKLVNSNLSKGSKSIQFNAQDIASGLYNCILKVDNEIVDTKKMVLLK